MSRLDELLRELCPDGVEYKALEDCCEVLDRKRKPVTKAARESGEFPYYGANGIQDYVDNYIFNGTFLLIGEDGSVINADKSPVINWATGKIWVNNHAHILQSLVSPEYLTNCLNSIDYFNYVYGTTRLKLTQENMNRILIPVPSIEEQLKIAQTINNLFALVENIKASLR